MPPVRRYLILSLLPVVAVVIAFPGCSSQPKVIATFPMDDLQGLLSNSPELFDVDTARSHDGAGSLHVFAEDKDKAKYMLYDIEDVNLKNGSVVWRAYVSTEALFRVLYFDIILFRADGTTRMDRMLCQDVHRNTDWQKVDVEMALLPDEDVTRIRLLVFTPGPGHIWLDEMEVWDGQPPDMIQPRAEGTTE